MGQFRGCSQPVSSDDRDIGKRCHTFARSEACDSKLTPVCTQKIAIGVGIYSAEWLQSTEEGQALLASSVGSVHRPRCMCRPGGVEMYVTRRGKFCYLCRMPGTGFLHAEDCVSVEESSLLSGAFFYAPGSITETDSGHLALAVNLLFQDRQPGLLTSLSIDGLLDILLEQANINRITPKSDPATWNRIREGLQDAASLIRLQQGPLTDFLFLPEKYSHETAPDVQKACETLLQEKPGLALVCAPLKEFRPTAYGWQLVLKHLPGLRLWLSKDLAKRLEDRWCDPRVSNPPAFALCLVTAKPGIREGNFTVENLACLPTNNRFLPCGANAEIADSLLGSGHSLMRPLRFDCDPAFPLADFALLDRGEPKPVFVLKPSGNEALDAAKRGLVSTLNRNNIAMTVYY